MRQELIIRREKEMEEKINSIYNSMSLEEKVGQLFIIDFRYGYGESSYYFDSVIKREIDRYHPGGVILFGENIKTLEQTYNYIKQIKAYSKIPLFMSIDEEGGIVARLGNNANTGFIKVPTAREIGSTNDPKNAYIVYDVISKGLKALGINFNFIPVADVYTNPLNEVVKSRTFSSDVDLVARMVSSSVMASNDNKVLTSPKHFPGHGDTKEDSHDEVAILNSTLDKLKKREFIPFQSAILAGAPFIMVGHIAVPSITGSLPSTVSKPMIDILKNDLGYKGLIITDAMDMKGISNISRPFEKAILAGVDVILAPLSTRDAYNEVLDAVKAGRISEDRLEYSVKKILRTKIEYGLFEEVPLEFSEVKKIISDSEDRKRIEEVRKQIVK